MLGKRPFTNKVSKRRGGTHGRSSHGVWIVEDFTRAGGFFASDHLGSVTTTLWANGTVRAETRYYPWGQDTRWKVNVTPTGARFTNQRIDDTLNLYNYNARYYDHWIGRFISADTIVPNPANPQSFNRYSYVLNSPSNFNDPSGHMPNKPIADIDGGEDVAGAFGTAALIIALLYVFAPDFSWENVSLWNQGGNNDAMWATHESTNSSASKDEPEECCIFEWDLDDNEGSEFVADFNIFQDRVTSEMSRWRDALLSDPNVPLYVPESADTEINWDSSTEVARRLGQDGGAVIIGVPDGDISDLNTPEFGRIDSNDMRILQTALELDLPLATLNYRMRNQINSNPDFRNQWGSVQIISYQ